MLRSTGRRKWSMGECPILSHYISRSERQTRPVRLADLRLSSGSERASLEIDTQTEASPLTTRPTGIESLD